MRVFLAGAGIPRDSSCIPAFERLAAIDRHGRHHLCDEPGEADAILFTECHLIADWRLRAVRASPIVERFGDRCYVYDERDRPWCALPGVYVSMPSRVFRPRFQRAWGYYAIEEPFVRLGFELPPDVAPDLLFSLVATRSHRSRGALLALTHPRAVVEEASGFVFFDPGSRGFEARRARFAEVLLRSKFVLCPRGRGVSSIRMYEAMAAGRVPVVISDEWVEPTGPDWGTFSVRWPEHDVAGLVAHLEEIEEHAERMGVAARRAFLEWFARPTAFHHLVEQISALRGPHSPRFPPQGVRGRRYLELALEHAVRDAHAHVSGVLHRDRR